MQLTHLKELREQQGLSLRELAAKSKVPYSAISILENGKREPHGRTVRKLAGALGVEVTELYTEAPVAQEIIQPIDDSKTITESIKPAQPTKTRAKKKQPAAGNCWVVDQEGDAFGPFGKEDANRLHVKLGGVHQARVYEAASKFEAWELHRQFIIRVARGHDAW